MKSIKNQYIALKEGKITEAQFMRNVRMTLPQYISNVTLFKQAERILLNKGIISEVKSEEIETVQDPETGNFTKRVKLSDKDKETIKKIQALMDKEKSLKEAKEGYFNQDGKEQYGKFDELDNMNAQEIMAGYVMEKIDNPEIDKKEAVKLVIKNLKKDQFYYTNYKLTGVRDLQPTEFTTTKRKSGFDDMEEINKNGDNFVDEKNKMVVIKEVKIEDVKSLLSDETLKNSKIGASVGNDVSIIYKDSRELPFDDLAKLKEKFYVEEDKLSEEGETEVYQYFVLDKMNEVTKPDTKAKLKEVIRKMMKEMFDGRDNLTDVTGEND